VITGNNPNIIKQALLKRGNWQEVINFPLSSDLER
jgi:SpoVK/Ycf46/Vps4 family AAA+-type ATPase